MLDFFKKMFAPERSSDTAKERLRLVLISDQLALAPEVVEALKNDLFEVISRYVEIDTSHADLTFEHRDREIAMLANIPILSVRDRVREQPRAPVAVAPRSNGSPTAHETPGHADEREYADDRQQHIFEAPPPAEIADSADVRYVNRDESSPVDDAASDDESFFDGVDVPAPLDTNAGSQPLTSSTARPSRRKRRRRTAASIAAAAKANVEQMPPGSATTEPGPA